MQFFLTNDFYAIPLINTLLISSGLYLAVATLLEYLLLRNLLVSWIALF
jgi:hypothetical protein